MKKIKVFIMLFLFTIFSLMANKNSIYAATASLDKVSSKNWFLATTKDGTDHSYYRYYVGRTRVWCIQCGVLIQAENYEQGSSSLSNAKLKQITYCGLSGKNDQIIQAAIWKIANNATIKEDNPENGVTVKQKAITMVKVVA